MAKNATYKLVYRPEGVSELYDLAADKRELKNVYNQPSYQNVSRCQRRMADSGIF